jgi:ATP-dependent RNA helicase DHX29
VTEPRRISAISLAQRVAKELGDQGANKGDGLVGYAIRMENNIGPNTVSRFLTTVSTTLPRADTSTPQHQRLAFVTNGIALRMLEADSDNGGKGKGSAFDQVTVSTARTYRSDDADITHVIGSI